MLLIARASLFFCTAPAPPAISTLSLHDAPPSSRDAPSRRSSAPRRWSRCRASRRPARRQDPDVVLVGEMSSEEHTSELQSRFDLVCRLLLEKKKHKTHKYRSYTANSHLCSSSVP